MENLLIQINKIGLEFLHPLSVKQTYNLIVTEAVKLLRASEGTLYLAEKNELKKVAQFPEKKNDVFHIRKTGFTYKAYKEKKVFLIPEKEIYIIHPELKGMGYKSTICIPLADHKKSLGTLLLLSHEKNTFTKKHIEFLKLFGSYASLAIRKAKAFEEREQALEMRDFFISMAAHELRTPLTAVNGYIQLLYRKLETAPGNESKWIKNLLWENQRLTLLINELLEVDQIKTGQFHFRWDYKQLTKVIDRAINNMKFLYPNRTFIFQNMMEESDDLFIGDFDKILQALTNILENAAKFSANNTDVLIKLFSNKNQLFVSIQDFGAGIPQDLIPKLFEGYAVHDSSEAQGMGLGMYLVKNILKLHHGEIDIKTKEKQGTTVTISLPKANN